MKKLMLIVIAIIVFAIGFYAGICHAERVYIEDDGITIPVDTDNGDIKTITHGDGTQTWIYNKSGQTDIVHPDGTTTVVYD